MLRRIERVVDTLEITFLIDNKDKVILNVHCSAIGLNDAKIGLQLATRNMNRLVCLAANKGYDSAAFKRWHQDSNVQPLINILTTVQSIGRTFPCWMRNDTISGLWPNS